MGSWNPPRKNLTVELFCAMNFTDLPPGATSKCTAARPVSGLAIR